MRKASAEELKVDPELAQTEAAAAIKVAQKPVEPVEPAAADNTTEKPEETKIGF